MPDERGHRHRADRVEASRRTAVQHGSAARATREAPPAEARLLKQRIAVVACNQAVLFHVGKSKALSVRQSAALAFACALLSTGGPQKPGDIVSKALRCHRVGWPGPESLCVCAGAIGIARGGGVSDRARAVIAKSGPRAEFGLRGGPCDGPRDAVGSDGLRRSVRGGVAWREGAFTIKDVRHAHDATCIDGNNGRGHVV